MPVQEIITDREELTITVLATYETNLETVWRLWTEPSLREKWWGPPGYPATFTDHDLVPGTLVDYHMTGPDGTRYPGWWKILSVEPPHTLVFEDGFSDAEGNIDESMPSSLNRIRLNAVDGVVTMRIEGRYATLDALEKVVAMGVEEGLRGAVGQIDELIASIYAGSESS